MEVKMNEENKYISGILVLCNIPYKNIKALIIYNHMINLDILNKGEKMILYINKKEKEISIKLLIFFIISLNIKYLKLLFINSLMKYITCNSYNLSIF